MAETVQAIKAMNSAVDGCMDVRVPFATGLLLTRLKHQLRDLIAKSINTREAENDTPPQLQSRVLAALKQAGVELSEPPFSEYWKPEEEVIVSYGYIPAIDIAQPERHPELLVAKTTLAINCGGDTSLYIFRRNDYQWTMVLALEANDYEDISGAQNDFDYAISPADEAGEFFIAAADVNAWCSSRWQMLRYKVLRIGASPYEPNIVFSAKHGILDDREPVFKLTATANAFQLDFWEAQSLDVGIMERAYILNYSLAGDRVTRIAPLASRPEDFLDEWINLPWEEAAGWVDAANREAMQRWHRRLQHPYTDDAYYYRDFSFIQPCREQKNTWQIGLNIDSQQRADVLPAELYFTITHQHGTFYLRDINDVRPPGCPGEASPYQGVCQPNGGDQVAKLRAGGGGDLTCSSRGIQAGYPHIDDLSQLPGFGKFEAMVETVDYRFRQWHNRSAQNLASIQCDLRIVYYTPEDRPFCPCKVQLPMRR